MARKEQVTCDVCGAQKQETNHWFTLVIAEQFQVKGVILLPADDAGWWDDIGNNESRVSVDLCGEACVLKKVSELISKQ